jgi:hypothetical protein
MRGLQQSVPSGEQPPPPPPPPFTPAQPSTVSASPSPTPTTSFIPPHPFQATMDLLQAQNEDLHQSVESLSQSHTVLQQLNSQLAAF